MAKVKVLLLQNVLGLGNAKSIVSVSKGYALNYLVPKGLAKVVNDDFAEEVSGEIENSEANRVEKAKKEKDILESKTLIFKVNAGNNDKLFGSIGREDIGEKIKEEFGIEIDKKKIHLDMPIKKLGQYKVPVKLYKDIQAEVQVDVLRQ